MNVLPGPRATVLHPRRTDALNEELLRYRGDRHRVGGRHRTRVGRFGDADGPSSVQDTVQQLQASGFTVVMNKTGNAPLQNCTISSARPGQTITRMDSGVPGAGTDHTTTVVSRTVYVIVSC